MDGHSPLQPPPKKTSDFAGGLRPPDLPIWACWGRPRGDYHPWGYGGSLLDEKEKNSFFPKPLPYYTPYLITLGDQIGGYSKRWG